MITPSAASSASTRKQGTSPVHPIKERSQLFFLNTFRRLKGGTLGSAHTPTEDQLRTLFDNARDVIFMINRDGVITSINQEFERATGLAINKLIGQNFRTLLHPNDVVPAWKCLRDQLRNKTPKTIELRVMASEGRCLTGEFVWSPQIVNGKVMSIIGVVRDVTRRKEAEERVQREQAKYHNLFHNSVQPMFQTSVEGALLDANKALLTLLAYADFQELAQVNMADLYVRTELRDELKAALASQGSLSGMELQLKKKNGDIVTVLEYSRALKDEHGTLIGFEGILEDITTRKDMEQKLNNYLNALVQSQKELARLNGEKDKLFSVLSHDLRSPFGSILGFCEVLTTDSETLTPAERSQFVKYIRNAAEDQLSLVNKLLDWSRFETGRVRMDLRSLNLGALAEQCVQNLSGLALKKRINLVSTLPSDLRVQGDEVFLRQVFDNIIGNALKFTPVDGTISIELSEKQECSIVLAIKDTGVGIPTESIERLFKPEEKYTTNGLEGEKGTGLGLSVCQEIMKKHGGGISVESEIGIGTTFTLTFVNNAPCEGLTVLVVDDEEGTRVLHSRYIKRIYPDANVVFASNGREGIEQALRLRPHIVITDYSMPLMDGYEVLVELKRYAETRNIPVLIITGDDSRASSESMVLSGAAAVLSKPVAPARLESELRGILGEVVKGNSE